MTLAEVIAFSSRSLRGNRLRTGLMLLAMSIGVGSIILLTGMGEAARRYVVQEFTELGTHLLVVLPGRTETTGRTTTAVGGRTDRELTLDDAMALYRIPAVRYVAPLSLGSAPAHRGGRERQVQVLGSTHELAAVRQLALAQGTFLPPGNPSQAPPVCVLGHAVKQEVFGNANALGSWLRLHDRRCRVIGVLAEKGTSIGVDFNEVVIVPATTAQALFNSRALSRVLIEAQSREQVETARDQILAILADRHDGDESVTVVAQDAVLATFDRIFRVLTITVAGIAAISLAVAGILIMNVMLVAVYQRTPEIGLLKALGARSGQVLRLFLTEASLLSLAGAALGILAALAFATLLRLAFPELPLHLPLWSFASAAGIALATGLLFGVAPARRAAALDPVQALTRRG